MTLSFVAGSTESTRCFPPLDGAKLPSSRSVPVSDSLKKPSRRTGYSAAAIAPDGASLPPTARQASTMGCAGAHASSFSIADAGNGSASPTSLGTATIPVGHSASSFFVPGPTQASDTHSIFALRAIKSFAPGKSSSFAKLVGGPAITTVAFPSNCADNALRRTATGSAVSLSFFVLGLYGLATTPAIIGVPPDALPAG